MGSSENGFSDDLLWFGCRFYPEPHQLINPSSFIFFSEKY
ncbi:hypothetical protein MCC93_17930 [Morococcus cerebrosus]|uniref:Uncharacterized protein n=2 Tax=Neisseriaceae TaxID=481 RepID=A0A0C1E4D8_9NEIS|nr:hypothetical protein HMPREF1051_1964 [Neisseria sicca VK64]KIC06829.1 hypothetical protein MCC93_17930 [Morococcus cerebrosus]